MGHISGTPRPEVVRRRIVSGMAVPQALLIDIDGVPVTSCAAFRGAWCPLVAMHRNLLWRTSAGLQRGGAA
jgi:hypothetical protein